MSNPIHISITQPGPKIQIAITSAGARGAVGPAGTNQVWKINQIPLGTIDGSNSTFTALTDFDPTTVEVMYNGVMLTTPDEFHTTGLRTVIITRTSAPVVGDKIRLNYQENI